MERLFEAGAVGVWHTSIQMNRNRPGILLSALAPPNLGSRLAEVFLRDTPTLGDASPRWVATWPTAT
jgi:uncharacterized protein (DUF111 family)